MLTTRQRVQVARLLSIGIVRLRRLVGRGPELMARRRGVRWRLDLRELIDLALYLGIYEKHLVRVASKIITPGAVVLDIGANMGVHSLNYAKLVGPSGRVLAFEPGRHAYQKLCENLALNPDLAQRVFPFQVFLTDRSTLAAPACVYASWPLADTRGVHPLLRGKLMSTDGARAISLDALVSNMTEFPSRLDFIKVDVEGNELGVLQGGQACIRRYRPIMQIEIVPYLQDEVAGRFDALLQLIGDLRYRLKEPGTGREIALSVGAVSELCPHGGGVDLFAYPDYEGPNERGVDRMSGLRDRRWARLRSQCRGAGAHCSLAAIRVGHGISLP
jgi:FkbM family methyltransferase